MLHTKVLHGGSSQFVLKCLDALDLMLISVRTPTSIYAEADCPLGATRVTHNIRIPRCQMNNDLIHHQFNYPVEIHMGRSTTLKPTDENTFFTTASAVDVYRIHIRWLVWSGTMLNQSGSGI